MNRKHGSLPILVFSLVVSLFSIGCIGATTGGAAKPATSAPSGAPSTHSVTITWAASTSEVAGYNVYRSTSSGGPVSKLATTLAASTEYIDNQVNSGDTYYYAITSVAADGMESSDSTLAIATVP
jgi:fibronectin type 3 domain-containing protein